MLSGFGSDDVSVESEESLSDGFLALRRVVLRHRLHAGGMSAPVTREVVCRAPVVAVLPYDPIADSVVLIEQFRIGPHTAGNPEPWTLEAVAGVIEPGERADKVAQRETREEAGLDVSDLVPVIGYYPSAGGLSEFVNVYVGRVDSADAGGLFGLEEEGEDIKAHVLPFGDAMTLLIHGRIVTAHTIIALQWLSLNYDRIREKRWKIKS